MYSCSVASSNLFSLKAIHTYVCCHYLHHAGGGGGGSVVTLVTFMKSTSGILPVVPLALPDDIASEAC
jgi:hypothetical protein